MSRTLLRRVTEVNAHAHVCVDGRWRPGTLWVALEALPCTGCGRRIERGESAVRGLGLPNGQAHAPLCTVTCRPFHLSPAMAARLEPGTVLPPGTAVIDDPQCECCRDERRKELLQERRLALRQGHATVGPADDVRPAPLPPLLPVPRLVVVSGAPGSGKSVLAARLAPELRLPLLAKDRLQHLLLDTLGASNEETIRAFGAAAFAQLYFVAHRLLDAGVGALLEANFLRGVSETALAGLTARATAIRVHCATADPAVTIRRYRERFARGERHPLNRDLEALPRLEAWLAEDRYDLAALDDAMPVLRVDTTDGYAPAFEEIVAFARATGAGGAADRSSDR